MAQSIFAPRAVFGVVFDGDDTLWSTEQLYDDARSRAANVVAEVGLDPVAWEERERRIDVHNVAKLGYSPKRFPTSCVQAYEDMCRCSGRAVDPAVVQRIREAAESVFARDAPTVPGARETLTLLRKRGARLALLTKGNRELQLQRLERSGLGDLFDVIQVVPEKSPDIIRDVVTAMGVDVGSAWLVGNSIRSDVMPAIRAGLRAVWIDAHVWEHEQTSDVVEAEGVITATRLADVPALIPS